MPAAVPAADGAPLSVVGLTVAYDRRPVLWDIGFRIPPGTMTAVVGPNGAGKSTLIKAMLGLVPMLSGTVRCFGAPVAKMRRRIAYVPQRESVDWDFPASALDVVTMGLYGRIGLLRPIRRRHRAAALAMLDAVGMADFADSAIGALSGGQQQRVFLARALAQEADVLLLDEPFAGVDAATERAVFEVLRGLRAAGKTVVCVHHDLATARERFDRALLVNLRLVADGPSDRVLTPENLQRTYGGRLPEAVFAPEPAGRPADAVGAAPVPAV